MKKSKNLVDFLKKTLTSYFTTEAISGYLLLFFAGAALFLANSKWSGLYETIVHYPLSFNLGSYSLKASFHYIINEGLMALFFCVVAMEVKRELIEGELSSRKKAALPLMAAIGGSVIPALIFFYFNQTLPTEKGWGIVMATDIAFAIGVISLFSHKVPFALKIFLLSIAIIDDIIAVLVIALFYSNTISGPFLAMVFIFAFFIFLYFKLRLHNIFLLSALSIALWVCMHESGIHATLSGVLLGTLVPAKNRWTEKQVLDSLKKTFSKKDTTSLYELKKLQVMVHDTKSILERLIFFYHPYVSYIIMPLFAFTNAGIAVGKINLQAWIQNPVSYGILIGLCLGKPIGITVFSYLSCLIKLSEKPKNISWSQIISIGCISGIGFTMSLFIMNLCFDPSSTAYSFAKLSVIFASCISAIVGLILLNLGKTVPLNQRKKPN